MIFRRSLIQARITYPTNSEVPIDMKDLEYKLKGEITTDLPITTSLTTTKSNVLVSFVQKVLYFNI